MASQAVAVFRSPSVEGDVLFTDGKGGVTLRVHLTRVPVGAHGFHLHKAGDMRGDGCAGLCEHYDRGQHVHGDGPHSRRERHTGDLGNVVWKKGQKRFTRRYRLKGVSVKDLWGRSIILHEDEDDLGLGSFEDSQTTGHSGKRMACAIIGRVSCATRRQKRRTT